jgi:two-component system, chemotaxis family, sensor histidine kinase and response regulator PixL
MSDKELQVRLQFLEEAREYLDHMESGLLGLGSGKIDPKQMDGVLRAAHSIKGGAAMMGFQQLSHFAHRLEDFFKILKVGKREAVDAQLESWLLSGVDCLRKIINFNRQQVAVDGQWLQHSVEPLFGQLYDRLGEPQPEDAAALLSAELGEDMSTLIFETEVEELLLDLESNLNDPEPDSLAAKLLAAAEELSGLGQMLELNPFTELCQSVIAHLAATPEKSVEIAEAAVQEWRRSQALVLIGQVEVLANELNLGESDFFGSSDRDDFDPESSMFAEPLPDSIAISSFFGDDVTRQAQELFSSLSEIVPQSVDNDVVRSKSEAATTQPLSLTTSDSISLTPVNDYLSLASNAPDSADSVEEKTIRVGIKQLEQLSDLFGEIAIERNGLNLRLKSLHNLVDLLRQRIKNLEQANFKLRVAYDRVATETLPTQTTTPVPVFATSLSERSFTKQIAPTANNSGDYFDSLEMDSYNDIHLLSQEVMETVVQIQEVSQDLQLNLEDTDKNARQLDRTTREMQNTITRVRMRPISDLLNRFPRALRDLELQYGKKVQLKIRGASTLIDRSILEALNDPLLHLFRNAFDHGIETPETRVANQKPARGTITITAVHRGNNTAITISDDGGGINLDKIKAKAISIGISHADIEQAREEDLLDLIFEPGFSTAERVTDLSGRGVGMDVVRTNIENIGGRIQVDTKLGVGTDFTIAVPFTLSIVRVLLVESNGVLLAFPTNVVEEMLILEPEMVLEVAGQEVLNWDGYIVRLIRLTRWLNLPASSYNASDDFEESPTIEEPTVLMIAQNNDLVGVLVDRYWFEQEVTIRAIEGNIPLPPGFTGCTILGDGRVVPLVDAIALLSWIENDGQTNRSSGLSRLAANLPQPKEIAIQKKIVMVVDDSINVRRFLALTLEKANYQVEQAKDGQDALEKLKAGLKPQAVICDIEMPRLDGFGFLSRARAEPQHKNLPIIMLTSRSGDKHRRLAMSLGATEYFSKPFKEQQLLLTLTQLIQ